MYFSPVTTFVTYEVCSNYCTEKKASPLNIYSRPEKFVPSEKFLKNTILSTIDSTWLSLTYGGEATSFQWSDSRNRNFPSMDMPPWDRSFPNNDINKWGYSNCAETDRDKLKYDHVVITNTTQWRVAAGCSWSKYLCVCQIPC